MGSGKHEAPLNHRWGNPTTRPRRLNRMADIARKATAHWEGDLKHGKGTNPEELLASAHAGCFTMQLSALLANHGHTIESLDTQATCEMVKDGPGFKVSAMKLVVRGKVTGSDQTDFEEHVKQAADMCPMSQVMKGNVEITHEAILE